VDHAVRRRDLPTRFRAAAPVRLDLAGAWTDVPPFSAREGGVVVNAAITLPVTADLQLGGSGIRLVSEDLSEQVECANSGGLVLDGRLNIHKAAVRMFPILGPFTLTTRSAAPPGAGLGGSGALDVALVSLLTQARQERLDARAIAEYGWRLETEAGIPGGRQDQLAAALGGFHRLTFRDPDVGIEPLTLDAGFAAALADHLVVCYTGRSRVSGDTISRVMGAYERGDPRVTGALRALKEVAERMAEALRAADLATVGAVLAENWRQQQALDPGMRTPEMARLEAEMSKAKVWGGKAAGAGAGGVMFFVTSGDREQAVQRAQAAGATVLSVAFASEGVRAW
jgi:D-glycero-alpha-D-manno-heptose-7-phosphate kinase